MTASNDAKGAPQSKPPAHIWGVLLRKKTSFRENTAHLSVNGLQLPPLLNSWWRTVISREETLGGFAEPSVEGIANEMH